MKKYTYMAITGIIGLAFSQFLIYDYAPLERSMGYAQKIFYYHLPLAWWSFVSFFISFMSAIIYLVKRKTYYDRLSAVSAEIGFLLATLTLITGSIWGRHSWGVWWTWDPRLTTTLVLWFIYAAYLVVRTMPMPTDKRAAVSAVITIIGFLDVPLVFFSARLWRSIHPAVFASKGGGLETQMVHTIIFCVLIFGFIYFPLLAFRLKQVTQMQKLETLRMQRLYKEA